jgi:hypothetical protein
MIVPKHVFTQKSQTAAQITIDDFIFIFLHHFLYSFIWILTCISPIYISPLIMTYQWYTNISHKQIFLPKFIMLLPTAYYNISKYFYFHLIHINCYIVSGLYDLYLIFYTLIFVYLISSISNFFSFKFMPLIINRKSIIQTVNCIFFHERFLNLAIPCRN